jgi:hypothetical protein
MSFAGMPYDRFRKQVRTAHTDQGADPVGAHNDTLHPQINKMASTNMRALSNREFPARLFPVAFNGFASICRVEADPLFRPLFTVTRMPGCR